MSSSNYGKASGAGVSEALAARRRESEADVQQNITPYSKMPLPVARLHV